ncbi:MAG: GYD domain-containing protein [Dehalococcoidia bacterium]|nr:GYD domain-containing protein [Dehalococcoidia bacterium]MDW8009384.1 GYD domain-containing protein [Chloroflexota bacterium]
MPTFIMLSTLTDDGAETVKENPDRIRQVREELEQQFGIRVLAQYAVLGPYDFVNIIEAPDIETVARVSAEMAARGSVKIQTLAAIPVDEFIARLKG